MSKAGFSERILWPTVVLAIVLWFITFYLGWLNFWIKISFSASLLAALSIAGHSLKDNVMRFDARAFIQGILSAAALYAVFWAGKTVSSWILPFASHQVGAIYGKGEGFPTAAIFFLLMFVTGPCEEIYWRGFLQRKLMNRCGDTKGWLLATLIYAGVHVWSFNFMLIGAAAVAGAFWGFLYMKQKRLDVLIISHSLWSSFIFAVLPLS